MSNNDMPFFKWCRQEIADCQGLLERYESGSMRLRRGPAGGPLEDITEAEIAKLKIEISNLSAFLERHSLENTNA